MKAKSLLAVLSTALALNLQAQDWTDITATYIVNPGFEECVASTNNVAANTFVNYSDKGWTLISTSRDWCCSVVMSYGSIYTLAGVLPPSTDNQGNPGNALGISIGRTYQIIYQSDEVTLPAGHYRLRAECYNSNSKTPYKSLLGFVPTAGTSMLSTLTSLPSDTWTVDELEFTLAESTTGCFQVGGQGTNNNISTADHAKVFIDNLTLEKQDPIAALLSEAYSISVPTDNIGSSAFQYPSEPINAFTAALSSAQAKYDAGTITDEDVTLLSDAINAYNAVKDQLNGPASGKTYKWQLADEWAEGNSNYAMNGAYVTLRNELDNQGGYVLSLGSTKTTPFTDEEYYAQNFTLTPVEGVINGYYVSMTDKDGNVRYLCSGAKVGGNNAQVRTSTNVDDALTIVVEYAGMKEEHPTFRLISTAASANTYISFTDRNSYCWGKSQSNCTRALYFHEKSESDLPTVSLNLSAGRYATRIFPFVRTISGDLISDLFNNKVAVYTCYSIDESNVLELTPIEGPLQAHVPYILEATDDISLDLTGYGSAYEPTTEYTEGLLTGTYASTGYAPEGCYVLQTHDAHQAFYRVDASAPIPMTSYRVYLTLSGSEIKSLYINHEGDETTGIESMKKEEYTIQKGDVIFNISGQLMPSLQSGMNIVRKADGSTMKIYK